jgi:small-conductance mechanosensitive channel
MNKKWYQDWHSWITIFLLFFVPTFLIGLIVMWLVAPWSKRAKWWITGIGLGIPVLGILLSFFLVLLSPNSRLSSAKDAIRRAGVQEISTQARRFCLDVGRCPINVIEIQQKGYLKEIPIDPDTKTNFIYQLTNDGKDCTIQTILSTKEVFSRSCNTNLTP